jgi:hypothetical protein
LGTDAERIANLFIAYNDAANGTATANLDFSVNNPTFTAFVSNDLSIGREAGAADRRQHGGQRQPDAGE